VTVRSVATGAIWSALPAILASAAGGLVAGVVLGGLRDAFRALPGLLALVPALLAVRGMVYGGLGARLATALHSGLIPPTLRPVGDRLRRGIAAALLTGVTVSALAAVGGVAVLRLLGRPTAPVSALLSVAVLASALSGVVLVGVVVTTAVLGFRRGHDPDALVGPAVTTTGDVAGTLALLVAVRVVS
jgi:mgtE-like transporter